MNSALWRLLLRAWAGPMALCQLGGFALLALATATESARLPLDQLAARMTGELPHAWALVSPALALAAGALALGRMRARGELLGLGSLGVGLGSVFAAGGAVALPVGLLAASVGRLTEPVVAVARIAGGWLIAGRILADPGGAGVTESALRAAVFDGGSLWPGSGLLAVAGALAGAALILLAGPRTVVVSAAALLVLDLVRRSSEGWAGIAWLFGACLVSIGFSAAAARTARLR